MTALWTSRAPVAPAELSQAGSGEEAPAPQSVAARRAEEARTLLITANLPIVGEVLRKYQGRRLPPNIDLEDLRQVGQLAVITAIDKYGSMQAPPRRRIWDAIMKACDRLLKDERSQPHQLPVWSDPDTGEAVPVEITGETITVKQHPVPPEVLCAPVNTEWLIEHGWTRALIRRFHPRTKGEVFEIEATDEFRSWKARLDQRRDRAAERKDGLDANDGCQDLGLDEYDAFRALSSRDQTIVRLLFSEGLPQREIAKRVGIAQQTVAWVKKRFEKRLHPELRHREPADAEERCSWLMTRPWYRARPSRDDTVEHRYHGLMADLYAESVVAGLPWQRAQCDRAETRLAAMPIKTPAEIAMRPDGRFCVFRKYSKDERTELYRKVWGTISNIRQSTAIYG